MLEMPKLNDQDISAVVAKVIGQIEKYGKDCWTDTAVHDPGITIIELLAYLKLRQQARIDKVDDKSLYKFMALLSLCPRRAACAVTQVCFQSEQNVFLPQGTRLQFHNLIYETQERLCVLANRIVAIGRHMPTGNVQMQSYTESDEMRRISIFGGDGEETSTFYIAFMQPLPSNEKIHLYFDVEDSGRNPLMNQHEFMPLATVIWEYYGGEAGQETWHSIGLVSDETVGFLFSGQMIFSLSSGRHAAGTYENIPLYCLRARLMVDGYDVLPVLRHIYLNNVEVRQKVTKCKVFSFTRQEVLAERIVFDAYLAVYGKFEIFIQQQDGYLRADECGIVFTMCPVENGHFAITVANMMDLMNLLPPDDQQVVLHLLLYDPTFFSKHILGSGDGIAEKIYQIQGMQPKEIVCADFKLLVKGKGTDGNRWNFWEQTVSLDAAKPDTKKFILYATKAQVQFGNNRRGKVPTRGLNNLLIAEMSVTHGTAGNSRQRLLQEFENQEAFPGVQIGQFLPAVGGEDEESVTQMMDRVMNAMDTGRSRAVTAEDYVHFARRTPGLLIEDAMVIPLYRPYLENDSKDKEENAVTVVVETYSMRREAVNPAAYLENVQRQMERVKLITTQIYVMQPVYLPVDIFGELLFHYGGEQQEVNLRKTINTYLRCMKDNTLYYGDMYFFIESFPAVNRIKYLSIEVENSIANAIGDVKLPPYARVYLREFTITASYSS